MPGPVLGPVEVVEAATKVSFVLDRAEHDATPPPVSEADLTAAFHATVAFWRRWLRRFRYTGRWRELAHRSALTLNLLTYAPTGAADSGRP